MVLLQTQQYLVVGFKHFKSKGSVSFDLEEVMKFNVN